MAQGPQKKASSSRSRRSPRGNRRRRPASAAHRSTTNKRSNAANQPHKSSVEIKYLNLLEQHLQMRRKYYERFDRVSLNERKNLERKFFNTIEQLRSFEESLSPQLKEKLQSLTDSYPKDRTYSSNRNINDEEQAGHPEVQQDQDFIDPHLLLSQKNREKFFDDTDITEGNYEDYLNYKGLK